MNDEVRATAALVVDRRVSGVSDESVRELATALLRLDEVVRHVRAMGLCDCSEAWTSRGRHDPCCRSWVVDEMDALAAAQEASAERFIAHAGSPEVVS